MAILQVGRTWAQKPPYGTSINRAHPLVQGMVGMWLLNEAAGNHAFNALGRQDMSVGFQSATSLPTWVAGPAQFNNGVKFVSSVTDQAVNCGVSPDFDCDSSGKTCTMEVWFYYNSTSAGAEKTLFAKAFGTSNSSPAMALAVIDNSPTNIRIRPVFLGLNQNNSAELFTNNALTHFACVFTNSGTTGSASVYVNGIFHNTISGAISGSMTGSALTIGGQQRTGSVVQESPDATIYKATIWNRVLSAAEIFACYANPWAMMQPPRRFAFTSAAAASSYFPFPPVITSFKRPVLSQD